MIEVVGCRILIKPYKIEEADDVFASAKQNKIIIPEFTERKEQTKIDQGTILMMGPTCNVDYVGTAKVGDVIAYAKFGGKFIEDPEDGVTYLVINDEDLVAILHKKKEVVNVGSD